MYTGNIIEITRSTGWQPVYPCVYREHYLSHLLKHALRGLSLCIQGTCSVVVLPNRGGRFIPVYTGNIYEHSGYYEDYTVYPCVYREHRFRYIHFHSNNGLSLCIQGT